MQSTFINTECCLLFLQEQRWELQIARNFLLNKEQHYIGLKTDLGSTTYPSLSHARVRARLPTAVLFFCCHKCHSVFLKSTKKLVFWGRFSSPKLLLSVVAERVKHKRCFLINAQCPECQRTRWIA